MKRFLLLALLAVAACNRHESTAEATTETTATVASTNTSGTITPGSTSPTPTATATIAANTMAEPDPSLAAEGAQVYKAECARCHKENGGTLNVPAITTASAQRLSDAIRGGQSITTRGMHRKVDISDRDLNSVIAYLQSLR